MARRTPDYTRQARRGVKGGKKDGKKGRQEVERVSSVITALVFTALMGGALIFASLCVLTVPRIDPDTVLGKVAVRDTIAYASGFLTNAFVGMIAAHALYPRRVALPASVLRMVTYALILLGILAIMLTSGSAYGTWAGPALIPPVAVYFFVVRPRLKAIAQAEGRYTPTRRDHALAEMEAERKAREREKEMLAKAKRRQAREQGLTAVKGGPAKKASRR